MTTRRLCLILGLTLGLSAMALGCSDNTPTPTQAPDRSGSTAGLSRVIALTGASGVRLSGAIFTTTPDGGIVNENVHYESKLEVYLDGGPPPNAPQHAAGLPDGWYVFQVTDPSGWVLLSQDPAKCRVVEIKDDIIIRLVMPSEFGLSNDYTVGNGGGAVTYPCHIQDEPDGVAGLSGHHDTNTDVDYGENGAIVVQLMPFLDTPNPGGVYKAWVTPFEDYQAMGGDLDGVPSKLVRKKGVVQGFANDPGFGPPRNRVKTDNFKVKEVPPMIHVHKFEDLNGNGVWDAGEPEIEGWKIYITETLYDGSTVTNECYTPCWRAVAPGATVTVTEELPEGWVVSHLSVDDAQRAPSTTVDVVFADGEREHTVVFGNYETPKKSGHKYHDRDGDGIIKEPGEEALGGWTIVLDGTDGKGSDVHMETVTNPGGYFQFMPPPGSYTVSEVCQGGWYQSYPSPTDGCGSGVYHIVLESGDVDAGNDFGNFQPVQVMVWKFLDCNGDGIKQPEESYLSGFEFCLKDAAGNLVAADDFVGAPQDACQLTGTDGKITWSDLLPGTYTAVESVPDGWVPTGPTQYKFTLVSGESGSFGFGNFQPVAITALKFIDKNADGVRQEDEDYGAGFEFCLLDAGGGLVSPDDFVGPASPSCQITGAEGRVTWAGLLPAIYTIVESPKEGFTPTTPTEKTLDFSKCEGNAGLEEFGNVPIDCRGLTPGYWKNWRNHYSTGQFEVLLDGSIASSIMEVDRIFAHYNASNPQDLTILRAFVLANQLTLKLTDHPELPNPSDGNLFEYCVLVDYPGAPNLGDVLARAVAIIEGAPASDSEILQLKTWLDKYANL